MQKKDDEKGSHAILLFPPSHTMQIYTDYIDDFFTIGNKYGGTLIQASGDVGSNIRNIYATKPCAT